MSLRNSIITEQISLIPTSISKNVSEILSLSFYLDIRKLQKQHSRHNSFNILIKKLSVIFYHLNYENDFILWGDYDFYENKPSFLCQITPPMNSPDNYKNLINMISAHLPIYKINVLSRFNKDCFPIIKYNKDILVRYWTIDKYYPDFYPFNYDSTIQLKHYKKLRMPLVKYDKLIVSDVTIPIENRKFNRI